MSAFVVGLTGPIGSGKSTVAAMLRELGARVLDADAIARDEQSRGTTGYSAIVQQFGTAVLGEDTEIDRSKLADIVFADPRRLEQLERILHPRVIADPAGSEGRRMPSLRAPRRLHSGTRSKHPDCPRPGCLADCTSSCGP